MGRAAGSSGELVETKALGRLDRILRGLPSGLSLLDLLSAVLWHGHGHSHVIAVP